MPNLETWLTLGLFIVSLLSLALMALSSIRCPKCKKSKKWEDWGDNRLCAKCEEDKWYFRSYEN